MQLPNEAERIRIFIGESDRHEGRLLSEVLVEKARSEGLAGATAYRGIMGYGANSRVHTSKILRLSEDMPLVIEIVDSTDKIDSFLKIIDSLITEGLVTREPVQVIFYRHSGG
ncbi:DUF190 domain-containing protein [Salidesulfovibrio brasiliensis]|uniref:DUF190 domain-containing protein n=1 Tax=Salidesulfovibrio brasiliensis TaxID=221711 RepID=UPI0006D01D96|nr:DUF190 domain-containing protein [Salidesulfovibrio brasiliensis]